MPPPEFADVDPRTLHLPPSLFAGADPVKIHRQIATVGDSTIGMPPLIVYRGTDGGLVIADGVTRATPGRASAPRALGPRGGRR